MSKTLGEVTTSLEWHAVTLDELRELGVQSMERKFFLERCERFLMYPRNQIVARVMRSAANRF